VSGFVQDTVHRGQYFAACAEEEEDNEAAMTELKNSLPPELSSESAIFEGSLKTSRFTHAASEFAKAWQHR
jgi:hypothetical protein